MPELNPKALHGLVGEVAERMQPQMEVSAMAVGVDLLCSLAHAVGPGPKTLVAGNPQPANFNVLKVGLTGVAKSYTAKPAERVLDLEIDWRERVLYDITTPAFLLGEISDQVREGEELIVRSEIEKQRLLRIDEFAVVLNRAKNPETTLLQYMNYAFDGTPMDIGSLAARERGGRSTGHYLSCITNTTPEALVDHSKLAANGFLNRFLMFWIAKRDVDIPSPERVDLSDLTKKASRVVKYWEHKEALLAFRPDAEELWDSTYRRLNGPVVPTAYGQMQVRFRVFIPRLSLAYAISDCSDAIRLEHLEAALALWDYHRQSAARVFGERTGNRHADAILGYLAEHGSSEKEPLNVLCGRSAICSEALAWLEEHKLVTHRKGASSGGRRPVIWEMTSRA